MIKKQRIPKRQAMKIPTNALAQMFMQQHCFQARFYDMQQMTKDERDKALQLMLHCIHAEAVEALEWLNWKPWKKKKQRFNRYEFLNELVDIQHFLINCAIMVGCSSREFAELFFNKGKENVARQNRGY